MRLLALVNRRAGGGSALRCAERWQAACNLPHDVEWVVTESPADTCNRIRQAAARGTEGIVLVGGDGTVHSALGALVEEGMPFGVLPAGRGNDFVRNLGAASREAGGLLTRDRLRVCHLDLATAGGVPYGSVACVGFDAEVNRLAREGAGYLRGTAGYVVCVLRALARFRPFEVEVEVDGWRWQGAITLVAVANGPCYGGGMRIAPQARMDDGVLDVCIVSAVPRATLLREFPKIFRGAHTSHPACIIRSGRSVTVRDGSEHEVFADGESVGNTPVQFAVQHGRLRVLQPLPESRT
jgi:diacylglycerol kinase (ATP)